MTDVNQIQARCNVWAKNRILDEIYTEKIKYVEDNSILDDIEAPEDLSQLIMDVRHELTPRQLEVFDLLIQGKSQEEICEELNIGDKMYYKHSLAIKEKIKNSR
jgi:DNA-binding NarL/FixJ family response regulator